MDSTSRKNAGWVSSVINLEWPSASSLTIRNDAERVKRQSNYDGVIDAETAAVLYALVDRHFPQTKE